MTNGKWLFLILFVGLIVITFCIVKESSIKSDNLSKIEQMSTICQDVILNDTTTYTDPQTNEVLKFTPPARDSAEMVEFLNFLESKGIQSDEKTTVSPMVRIGNYWDGADRRVPVLVNGTSNDTTTPEQCATWAKNSGFTVAGIQYHGECWGGNDLFRAQSYGPSVFYKEGNPEFAYGRGWNNFLMADLTSKSCSVNDYSKYVEEMLRNRITSYEMIKNLSPKMGFVGSMEGFVEGATTAPTSFPPQDPANSNIMYSDFEAAAASLPKNPNMTFMKTSFRSFMDEVALSGMKQNDFIEVIKEFNSGNAATTDDVQRIRSIFTKIGFPSNNSMVRGIQLLRMLRITKEMMLMSNFPDPYTQMGLGPDKPELDKLVYFAANNGVSESLQSKLRMSTFVEQLTKSKISISDLNELSKALFDDMFYTNTASRSPDGFIRFITDVKQFSGNPDGTLIQQITEMKTTLNKYQMSTYSEYVSFKTDLLNSASSSAPINVLMEEFYKYYTVTSPEWFNSQSVGATLSFQSAFQLFINHLRKFGLNRNTDLYVLVQLLNDVNIPVGQITESTLGERSLETFTDVMEPMSRRRRGNVSKLADALRKMNIRDINKIQVSSGGKTMTEREFDQYLVSKMPGISEQNKIDIVIWFSQLSMMSTDIDGMFVLLQKMGIRTYKELDILKSQMRKLGVNSKDEITKFLDTISRFGVPKEKLDSFINELSMFGVSLSTQYRKYAYDFIDRLTRYDITYTMSPYDSCNTKFSNFIYNMALDSITFGMYDFMVVPLLRMLNNGVEPSAPPKTPTEKQKLNRNMRDLIIRRDKAIYTGNELTPTGYAKCNNQFPDLRKHTPEQGFKNDIPIYQAAATNQSAGMVPPFLYELNNEGKEEPMVKLVSSDTVEKVPNKYVVKPQIIKTRLFWVTVLLNGKNQPNKQLDVLVYPTPPLNYKQIVANLTNFEYQQFQTGKPNLIVPSVMSRLYAKLVADANAHKSKGDYSTYNSCLDQINYIRILPYYSFRLIAREISANPKKYDEQQNPEMRENQPGLKPFFPEGKGQKLDGYDEEVDRQVGTMSNRGKSGKWIPPGNRGPQYATAKSYYKPVVY